MEEEDDDEHGYANVRSFERYGGSSFPSTKFKRRRQGEWHDRKNDRPGYEPGRKGEGMRKELRCLGPGAEGIEGQMLRVWIVGGED